MKITNNQLVLGNTTAAELVKEYGSPIYVYEEETIRQKMKELKQSIPWPKLKIYYACKANTNPHIMKIIKEEGGLVDVLSPGEIAIAEHVGFKPEEMMFTSTSVTSEEIQFVIDKKIMMNCDSISQLERYGNLHPNTKVSVRINPDVGGGHHGHVITGGPDSKFGVYHDKVSEIKAVARRYNLKIVGVHHHIGSGILDAEKFMIAMKVLFRTAKQFDKLEFISFGGGLGIPYKPDQKKLDMKNLGKQIADAFFDFCQNYGAELFLCIEPGRFVVAESGFLLCKVNTLKETPKHKFAGVDTGFNHLIRPAMYGSYHEIIVANNVKSEKKEKVAVAGNVCESGDLFTRDDHGPVDRELPKLKEGDILAICNAGAYGFAMASNYNARLKPMEILVGPKGPRVIRKKEDDNYLLWGY